MPRYGIIDLGSNTIRLCIYEVAKTSRRPLQKKDIRTLINYKIMAGLASHVHDGHMGKKGIKRAISTISAHLRRAEHFDCDEIHVFATAVLRNAENSLEATRAIEDACKIRIRILSNYDEAHLGFVGAKLDQPISNGVMVDIGGGSTELTYVRKGNDQMDISIPQGSLSSFATFVRGLTPTLAEEDAIAASFREQVAQSGFEFKESKEIWGIGGSIRSSAKVYGDVVCSGNRSLELLPEQVDELLERFHADSGTFFHKALQTIPDRVHTFIPGLIIIREIFSLSSAEKLTVCKSGIREGYLIDRILGMGTM